MKIFLFKPQPVVAFASFDATDSSQLEIIFQRSVNQLQFSVKTACLWNLAI
jgi:hypothetical protein